VFWLLVALTFHINFKNIENSDQWRTHTCEVLQNSEKIISNVLDSECLHRNYIIIGEPEYLNRFNTAENAILPSIEALKKLTVDNPLQQKRLKSAESIAKYRITIWNKTLEEYKNSGFEAAKKYIIDNYQICGIVKMGELKDIMTEVVKEEEKLLIMREKHIQSDFTRAHMCIYIAFFISGLIFLYPLVDNVRKQFIETKR
jgi:CHASE3 domain sensor protein